MCSAIVHSYCMNLQCLWATALANTRCLPASIWCLGGVVVCASAHGINTHILLSKQPIICKALFSTACLCSLSANMASAYLVRQL
ncbi:hypothetical protein COO60DRAFT_1532957, partial [Scenedesmus sp. NREL 46B-D3]